MSIASRVVPGISDTIERSSPRRAFSRLDLPTFVFFANDAASIHFSYRRYLENQIRDAFGFHGTPIKLVFRDRESVKLPRRRSKAIQPARRVAAAARRPKR